jgi:shikimate dehydrogenase
MVRSPAQGARDFLLGLIGTGIGPSLSPPLHEHEAAALGHSATYRLLDLDEMGRDVYSTIELVRAAGSVGFDGLNLTHPCKRIVVDHLDELSPEAARLGAVNTVVFEGRRAVGHNTDGTGFAESFRRTLATQSRDRVVLLGAGGAGTAVAHALLSLDVNTLTIIDIDSRRAAALTHEASSWFSGRVVHSAGVGELESLLRRADGLVHATPVGMAAHPGLPLPIDALHPGLWVADIVYRPLETELIRTARDLGCAVLEGGGMVVFQAAEAFRLFTGLEPCAERMLEDFQHIISSEATADASR